MKVLFISSGNSKTGISPIIKNQGESLKKEGVSIDYFTIKGKGLRGYLKNICYLKIVLKKNEYSIIHAHYSLSAIVSLLTLKKIPIVVSFMGDDLLGSQNSSGKYTLKGKIIVFLSKYIISRLSSLNIVKSDEMQRILFNSRIIPNGVNFNRFKAISRKESMNILNLDVNKKYILFPANPNRKEKNYNLAKNSVDMLNDKKIVLLNFDNTPNEQTPYFYNASSVVLLTSFHEGSPNVIKEAMACSIPIVSTNVGDVQKVIGKTEGCYITSFDPIEISNKLKKAIDFGKRTNGRNDLYHLSDNVIAKKIINIYNKLI